MSGFPENAGGKCRLLDAAVCASNALVGVFAEIFAKIFGISRPEFYSSRAFFIQAAGANESRTVGASQACSGLDRGGIR